MSEQRQHFQVDVNNRERGQIIAACGRMRGRDVAAALAHQPSRDYPAFEMGELLARVCEEWMEKPIPPGRNG